MDHESDHEQERYRKKPPAHTTNQIAGNKKILPHAYTDMLVEKYKL
jgi:hypothetical protein